MAMKLGRTNFLLVMRKQGLPEVGLVCTQAAYQRKDGSVYIIDATGARQTLTPCEPVNDPTWPYKYRLEK